MSKLEIFDPAMCFSTGVCGPSVDPELLRVATNDLIILVAFIPIVKLLLGVSNVTVPWDTLILSVVIFVVVPLLGGFLTRYFVIKKKGIWVF